MPPDAGRNYADEPLITPLGTRGYEIHASLLPAGAMERNGNKQVLPHNFGLAPAKIRCLAELLTFTLQYVPFASHIAVSPEYNPPPVIQSLRIWLAPTVVILQI
jgi:hypothetical protein